MGHSGIIEEVILNTNEIAVLRSYRRRKGHNGLIEGLIIILNKVFFTMSRSYSRRRGSSPQWSISGGYSNFE
jgi:hypothetical protein